MSELPGLRWSPIRHFSDNTAGFGVSQVQTQKGGLSAAIPRPCHKSGINPLWNSHSNFSPNEEVAWRNGKKHDQTVSDSGFHEIYAAKCSLPELAYHLRLAKISLFSGSANSNERHAGIRDLMRK